jgi:hypothetical protein
VTSGDPQPWDRAGWLVEMTGWIDGRLRDSGIRRHGPVEQVRSWSRAAVFAVDTDRSRMWAKQVPGAFSHEIAVTELLADIDPGIVPPVVAADRALGRILTEHVAGPVLASLAGEPAIWAATMGRLAEVQRVLAGDPAALAAAGVAASPLRDLASAIPGLLGDDDLLMLGRPGGLSREEAAAIRGRIPELVEACRSLDASSVPDSLDHGDLTTDQVIVGEMGPVFLDWSDSSITHPFLSAASFLSHGGATARQADEHIAAYLAPWSGPGLGLTAAAGREALDLARTVLPLHIAHLYAERVLPSIVPRRELEGIVPSALRTILDA